MRVEIEAFALAVSFEQSPRQFAPGGEFEEIRWARVDEKTLSRMAAAEVRCVKAAISELNNTDTNDEQAICSPPAEKGS